VRSLEQESTREQYGKLQAEQISGVLEHA